MNKIQIKTAALICITLTIASFAGCATRTGSEAAKFLTSLEPQKSTGFKPGAIHLTYEGDPSSSITVQWKTESMDEAKYKPAVLIAKTESALKQGYPECKQANQDGCELRGGGLDGLVWSARLDGLLPDTNYYYAVGEKYAFEAEKSVKTKLQWLVSDIYNFKTGIPKGGQTPFVFAFGSDSQSWKNEASQNIEIIKTTTGKDVRFWLFGGDLVELNLAPATRQWFEAFAPLLRYYALMPVAGNHEVFTDVFTADFSLPKMDALPPEVKELAWSFDFGCAHFVGFYATSEKLLTEQLPWLESDLKSASQDPNIKWIITVDHQSAYSSGRHGNVAHVKKLVSPLFDKYGVAVAFSGHDHNYERTKPICGGKAAPEGKGTIYVISGGFYSKKSYKSGGGELTVVNIDGDKSNYVIARADCETLSVTAYNGEHERIDAFELKKK